MNTQLLLAINSLAGKNYWLDMIMVFCASYLVFGVFLAALICVGYLAYEREWRTIVYFAAALIVSFALLLGASHLVTENRPFVDHHLTQLVAHAAGKSFPSDHTTVATAIAFGLLFFTRFKKIGLLILTAAVVIGFARVFSGIHYPGDILGGLTVGLLGSLIIWPVKIAIDKRAGPRVFKP